MVVLLAILCLHVTSCNQKNQTGIDKALRSDKNKNHCITKISFLSPASGEFNSLHYIYGKSDIVEEVNYEADHTHFKTSYIYGNKLVHVISADVNNKQEANTEELSFHVNGGKISQAKFADGTNWFYSYSGNYCTDIEMNGKRTKLIWENSDLVGSIIKDSLETVLKIEYGNYRWPKGFIPIGIFDNFFPDKVLLCNGFYGRTPQHLPIRISSNDGSEETIDYIFENGIITHIIKNSKTENERSSITYILEWK